MNFRLLGPLQVWDRGRQVELRRPKQRALLAILVLRAREPVSSEALIDALWGESAPRTARAALQNYVAQLRRALGPGVLESSSGGYLLHVASEQIDLGRFERLVEESRAVEGEERIAKLQEALALWQGPPLSDLAFEPFAVPEISRLEDLRSSTVEDLIDAQLALGAGAELLERLDALIAAPPFRERLRGERVLALYRDGRQAEALEAYLEARGMLLDELGIEPGTALRELEQAMLRQDPSLDAPARPATEALPPEGRRKVVTILFADVASPDTLDPELLRATSTDALGRMRSVLETHGATIEQRGGDEVMAVFGVPTAYEDDPLRAVRAALELRAEWSFAAGSPRERSSPARTTRTASSRARRSRSPSGFCKPPRQGRSWSARRRSSCSATRRCRSQSERRGGSSSSSREPRLRLGIWTRRSWVAATSSASSTRRSRALSRSAAAGCSWCSESPGLARRAWRPSWRPISTAARRSSSGTVSRTARARRTCPWPRSSATCRSPSCLRATRTLS